MIPPPQKKLSRVMVPIVARTMIVPTLTTHAEKVAFVKNYIQAVQQAEPDSRPSPLMIFGKGGEGKTKVVQEVVEASPIPIMLLNEDYQGGTRYHPGTNPQAERCAVIHISLGQPEDFKVADYFRTTIVEFKPDPSMPSTTYT